MNKDITYIKLLTQLNFIIKKLKRYLSDDEIAKLIALGLKEGGNSSNENIQE